MSPNPPLVRKLPARDWILLPLVSLCTLGVLFGAAEIVSRVLFPESGRYNCDFKDAAGNYRSRPYCVAFFKNAEGPPVEYRFNACGYRSVAPCGPKPAGGLRIALMGTSIAMGMYVPYAETIGARTEQGLSRHCGRHVEVQNLGTWSMTLDLQPRLVQEVIGLKPDLVVFCIAPYDLKAARGPQPQKATQRIAQTHRISDAALSLRAFLSKSRAMLVMQHLMLTDEQFLYRSFISYPDEGEILSTALSPGGQSRYGVLADSISRIATPLRTAGIPLLVVAVPNRIAAALVSNHHQMEGIDGAVFGRRVEEIAKREGALYLDTTPEFARTPHAEALFYPFDNHPDPMANGVVAKALINRLTSGDEESLAGFRTPTERTGRAQ